MNKTLKLGLVFSALAFSVGVEACGDDGKVCSKPYCENRINLPYAYTGNRSNEMILARLERELRRAEQNNDHRKVVEIESKIANIDGTSGTYGAISVLKKEFGLDGHGFKPMASGILMLCTVIPLILAFKEFWKEAFAGTFKDRFVVTFKKLFGGVKFKVTSTASHCDQIFTQLKVLIREATGYASREVGRAMNARDRIPDVLGQDGLKEGENASDQEQGKEQYKCPLCKKSDGTMTFFFNCKKGEKHGIHPVCAKEWFKNSPSDSLFCPTCKAPRKFEVMEPDVIVSALTENLGLTSILPSVALSFRSAQKKIAGLIRQIEKDRNKNKLFVEKSLLVALHMDMDQICEIIDGCSSYKDFCNQDVLEKLSIYSTKGSNNCKILNSFVNGTFDFTSRGYGQSSYYSGVGSGVGGYGSGYGNYQS